MNKKSSIYFVNHVLGISLTPWQLEILQKLDRLYLYTPKSEKHKYFRFRKQIVENTLKIKERKLLTGAEKE